LGDIEVDGKPLFTSSMLTSLAGVAGSIQAVITGASGFLNASAPSLGLPDLPTSIAIREAYIAGGAGRITELMQITKLPRPVVEVLWSYILEQQGILDAGAEAGGQLALRCGYFNQDLWVLCYNFEDGEYTYQTTDPGDPDAVFLAAGTTFSLTSQEDANALALLTAADVPACLFDNQLVEIDCDEIFPGGDYSPSVLFRWPRDDSPEINIDAIGGRFIIGSGSSSSSGSSSGFSSGSGSSSSSGVAWKDIDGLDVRKDIDGLDVRKDIDGLDVLTYSEVLANGVRAQTRELINRVNVAPGAVTGRTQAEANEKARAIAISYLDCFIPSREQELKCTDADVSLAAYNQVSAASSSGSCSCSNSGSGSSSSSGSCSCSIEPFVQEVLSEIVTGYKTLYSELSTLRPDNVTFIETTELVEPFATGPAIDERVAVRLFVPAGAFVGDSHIDAESSANGYTRASIATKMDCDWRSRSVTYACDDSLANYAPTNHLTDTEYVSYVGAATAVTYLGPYEIELKEGRRTIVPYPPYSLQGSGAIEMMASVANSTPYLVNSERGLFSSSTSQADADLIAAANAVSQLDCIYCNPEIAASCPPGSYDAIGGAPGVPYYFDEILDRWRIVSAQDSHVAPYTHHPLHAEGLVPSSYDPEPFICGDPEVVITIAGESGRTPTRLLTTSVECRECNDFLTAACCGPVGEISIVTFSPDQCVDLIQDYEASNSGADCGGAGSGGAGSNPTNVVSIPECTVFASTKVEANALAANIITASLNCFFVSDECERECENPCVGTEGAPFSVVVNGNTYESVHQALCESEGSAKAVVARGLFRSNCSKEQANEQACALAEAQLTCIWVNTDQKAECPEPGGGDHYHRDAVLSVTVEAGAIISVEGCCAADIIALRMAALQLYCVFGNDEQDNDPGCISVARPRTVKAADNCGDKHTKSCNSETKVSDPVNIEPIGTCAAGASTGFGNVMVIAVDTVVSTVSTEAANAVACGMLVTPRCSWVNNEVNVSCDNTANNTRSDNAVTEVFIPQGDFTAETMCDATEQAFRTAVSQLFCEWTNDEQEAECKLGVGDHYHPDAVELATVAKGTLVGCRSTAEYNKIALEMAKAKLYCVFGNDEQDNDPGCISVERPRTVKAADNCGDKHTQSCNSEDKSVNPPNVGAAGTCAAGASAGFGDVMVIAVNTVVSTVSTEAANAVACGMLVTPRCVYENNEVNVSCDNTANNTRSDNAVVSVKIGQGEFTGETMCDATEQAFRAAVAQLFCEWTNDEQEAECKLGVGDHYHPAAVKVATVDKGTLVGCKSTDEYNKIALEMAKAKLQCLYGNDYVEATGCLVNSSPRSMSAADNCGGIHAEECGIRPGDDEESYGGIFTAVAADTVSSTTSTDAANILAIGLLETLPKCSFRNKEINVDCENKGRAHQPSAVLSVHIPQGDVTGTTMCDATEQAFRMAVAQLQCLWTNEEQTFGDCPYGFELVVEGKVEANTLIQCSTAIADAIALAMAKAQVRCQMLPPPVDWSSSGSDKSTAIVPLPGSKYGYTALLTMEAPEVLFEDVLHVPIKDRLTRYQIDPRFIAVCEPKSVNAISVTTDRPALVGARVIGGAVVLEINPMGDTLPSMAHVKLCGTRRGFAGMRFPDRDKEQFDANEKTLNSAYPAKDL
jgi:hypothetical protein